MSRACSQLGSVLQRSSFLSVVTTRCLHATGSQPLVDLGLRAGGSPLTFEPVLLDFLVCTLSKNPLIYETLTNELINEKMGINYLIISGIPNMITHENKKQEEVEH
jgi:uncharacterized protein YbaR (Trm112 family)